MVPLNHYLVLSGILFSIGTAGVFLRRNLITILLEYMDCGSLDKVPMRCACLGTGVAVGQESRGGGVQRHD